MSHDAPYDPSATATLEAPAAPSAPVDAEPAPGGAPTGWRYRVLGIRGVAAVALASLIVGGGGGLLLGRLSNGADNQNGRGFPGGPGGRFQQFPGGQNGIPGGQNGFPGGQQGAPGSQNGTSGSGLRGGFNGVPGGTTGQNGLTGQRGPGVGPRPGALPPATAPRRTTQPDGSGTTTGSTS